MSESRKFMCTSCGIFTELNNSWKCQACAIVENQNRIDSDNRRRLERDRKYEELMNRETTYETYGGLFPAGRQTSRQLTRKEVEEDAKFWREEARKNAAVAKRNAGQALTQEEKSMVAEHDKAEAEMRHRWEEQDKKNLKNNVAVAVGATVALTLWAGPMIYWLMNWNILGAIITSAAWGLFGAPVVVGFGGLIAKALGSEE